MAVSDFWILIWFSKVFPGSEKVLAKHPQSLAFPRHGQYRRSPTFCSV